MPKFKSKERAQHFLSSFGLIYEHFSPKRDLMKAADYRQIMPIRFQVWQGVAASIGC